MKVTIKKVSNGFVIKHYFGDAEESYISTSELDMLQIVQDLLCENESRYADKKIYIIEAPGDKSENFTEAHSKVIFG